MKLSGGEKAVLAITALLVLFMGGWKLWTGRTLPAEFSQNGGTAEEQTAPAEGRVDVNTAGLEELMTLPGIGEVKAKAILDYRAEHGPFAYVEDLIRVPGIGEGIVEELLEYAAAGGTEYAENTGS